MASVSYTHLKLLKMVRKDGTSTIGGICYTGMDLLKIFLKKLLEYPFKEFHTDEVAQLVITMHKTDARVTDCRVSYTHLDVYKRQAAVSALMIFIPDFLRKGSFFWEKRSMTLPQALS